MYQYLFSCICDTGHRNSISQLCPKPKLSFILFQSFSGARSRLFHCCLINTVLTWQFLTQDLFPSWVKGSWQHKMGGYKTKKKRARAVLAVFPGRCAGQRVQSWAECWAVILRPRSIWSRRPTQPAQGSRENILINSYKLIFTQLILTLS